MSHFYPKVRPKVIREDAFQECESFSYLTPKIKGTKELVETVRNTVNDVAAISVRYGIFLSKETIETLALEIFEAIKKNDRYQDAKKPLFLLRYE